MPMTRDEWDAQFYRTLSHCRWTEGLTEEKSQTAARSWMLTNYGARPEGPPPDPNAPRRAPWYLRLVTRVAGVLGGVIVGGKFKAVFNRWSPVIGGAVLGISELLKALGQPELASMVRAAGDMAGVSAPAWVVTLVASIVPAVVVLYGTIRKVLSQVKAARKG
jgi:hypothetical protein